MSYAYTFNIAGGFGVFGRFAIALVILLVLKNTNKNDPELDSGLRKLLFIGAATLLTGILLVILWFVFFGAAFTLPFIGYFY